ncbi:neuromedin-U receptor 1-like [Physella acuta]|uniref:neuromedin-U receptor 1-like n=1 Tax=Physella acuta TaxID=109671 RepID=UPI0027DAE091|nr:neuromedin-U receptor 1-like [Physella acuta]
MFANSNPSGNFNTTGQDLEPDDPGVMLSNRVTHVFIMVNYVFLSTIISLFGIAANSLNMRVLARQGFHNTMNISFMGMAISDMASLVTLLFLNVCLSPFFHAFNEIHYLFGAWLHGCAARITGWITVYITVERYLSIARPLQVKTYVTAKRAVTIICLIYVFNLLTLIPEVSTIYLDWNMFLTPGAVMESITSSSKGMTIVALVFSVHAFLTIMSFIALAVFTSILVIKLKEKSKWRSKATHGHGQDEAVSVRDKKTVTVIIFVATLLILCYVPTVTFSIVSSSVPEFSLFGRESNVFYVAWSFAFITHSCNSSVIIFIYYKMSSRYRATFKQVVAQYFHRRPLEQADVDGVNVTNTRF